MQLFVNHFTVHLTHSDCMFLPRVLKTLCWVPFGNSRFSAHFWAKKACRIHLDVSQMPKASSKSNAGGTSCCPPCCGKGLPHHQSFPAFDHHQSSMNKKGINGIEWQYQSSTFWEILLGPPILSFGTWF